MCRFSTDLQRDASIEDQLRLGRELAAKGGYEVVEVYSDARGNVEVTETIRALVDRIVLTPSAENPRVPVVDLEGMLAQLFWLGLEHKDQTGTRTAGAGNKKAASHREAADLQLELVAGAGFGFDRTAGRVALLTNRKQASRYPPCRSSFP